MALVTGLGLAIALLADRDVAETIAWTLWIVGALGGFVMAGSGSTAEMMSGSRHVVGGRFTSSPPLPQSPLQYALVGLVLIGVGTLVFLYG